MYVTRITHDNQLSLKESIENSNMMQSLNRYSQNFRKKLIVKWIDHLSIQQKVVGSLTNF